MPELIVESSDDESDWRKSSATIFPNSPREEQSSSCTPRDVGPPLATSAKDNFVIPNQNFCTSTSSRDEPQAQGAANVLDEKLQVLEVCCGCARLTFSCMKEGLNALGIDWKGCKDKPEGRVIWLDLTTKRGMRDLKDILEANKHTLKIVFMSPPCGTASRAREIRRTKPDAFGKVIDPKPLRSDEHPDGLPDLGGIALQKVKSANVLYENMIEIALWCDEHGISWILENPSNSHIWETKAFKKLRKLKWADKLKTPYERTQFQNCMHGGDRA